MADSKKVKGAKAAARKGPVIKAPIKDNAPGTAYVGQKTNAMRPGYVPPNTRQITVGDIKDRIPLNTINVKSREASNKSRLERNQMAAALKLKVDEVFGETPQSPNPPSQLAKSE